MHIVVHCERFGTIFEEYDFHQLTNALQAGSHNVTVKFKVEPLQLDLVFTRDEAL